MCGIIGVFVKKEYDNPLAIARKVYLIYKNQKSRGKDGFGIAIMRPNEKIERLRTKTEKIFHVKNGGIWSKINKANTIALFHHRFPTSTANNRQQNHPIMNEDKSMVLIHNGIIGNADELYDKLVKKGHKFETRKTFDDFLELKEKDKQGGKWKKEKLPIPHLRPSKFAYAEYESDGTPTFFRPALVYDFNDSETIMHLLEESILKYGEDKRKEYMQSFTKEIVGSYAVAWIKEGEQQINIFRNSNPIEVYNDNDENIYFSSEKPKNNLFKDSQGIDMFSCARITEEGLKKSIKIRDAEWNKVVEVYDANSTCINPNFCHNPHASQTNNSIQLQCDECYQYFHKNGMTFPKGGFMICKGCREEFDKETEKYEPYDDYPNEKELSEEEMSAMQESQIEDQMSLFEVDELEKIKSYHVKIDAWEQYFERIMELWADKLKPIGKVLEVMQATLTNQAKLNKKDRDTKFMRALGYAHRYWKSTQLIKNGTKDIELTITQATEQGEKITGICAWCDKDKRRIKPIPYEIFSFLYCKKCRKGKIKEGRKQIKAIKKENEKLEGKTMNEITEEIFGSGMVS